MNYGKYSLDDHYRWGFGDSWFNMPENPRDCFRVSLGSCKRGPLSLREECVIAAKQLSETITKPLLVGLSGGFDSQVVCLSFMAAGVPFTPVVLRLTSDSGAFYNQTDYANAMKFCSLKGIVPLVETLNLDEFYRGEGLRLIQDNCITVAEIAVQLHLVIKYKDTHAYVNGGGDPTLSFMNGKLVYSLMPTPIQQYMINNGIEGCLKFFMYSPEQIAAYLQHPVMQMYNAGCETLHDGYKGPNIFTFVVKPMMYLNQWPELVQRKKQTGFEQVPYFAKMRELTFSLNEHINPRAKKITWTYEQLVDHLMNGQGAIKTWRSVDEHDTSGPYPSVFTSV